MGPPPLISEELATFLQSGLSIAIGTRDAALAPEGARVWSVRVEPDRAHLEAFLFAPSAGATLRNLEQCPQMALVFDRPTDNRACQVKGTFLGWRPAGDGDRPDHARQFEGFCDSLAAIGIPRAEFARGAQIWPAIAVRVRMTDVFKQDPGPGAGERVT
jgi:hypothetical protein